MIHDLAQDTSALIARVRRGDSVYRPIDLALIYGSTPILSLFITIYFFTGSAWSGWCAAISLGMVSFYLAVICPLLRLHRLEATKRTAGSG